MEIIILEKIENNLNKIGMESPTLKWHSKFYNAKIRLEVDKKIKKDFKRFSGSKKKNLIEKLKLIKALYLGLSKSGKKSKKNGIQDFDKSELFLYFNRFKSNIKSLPNEIQARLCDPFNYKKAEKAFKTIIQLECLLQYGRLLKKLKKQTVLSGHDKTSFTRLTDFYQDEKNTLISQKSFLKKTAQKFLKTLRVLSFQNTFVWICEVLLMSLLKLVVYPATKLRRAYRKKKVLGVMSALLWIVPQEAALLLVTCGAAGWQFAKGMHDIVKGVHAYTLDLSVFKRPFFKKAAKYIVMFTLLTPQLFILLFLHFLPEIISLIGGSLIFLKGIYTPLMMGFGALFALEALKLCGALSLKLLNGYDLISNSFVDDITLWLKSATFGIFDISPYLDTLKFSKFSKRIDGFFDKSEQWAYQTVTNWMGFFSFRSQAPTSTQQNLKLVNAKLLNNRTALSGLRCLEMILYEGFSTQKSKIKKIISQQKKIRKFLMTPKMKVVPKVNLTAEQKQNLKDILLQWKTLKNESPQSFKQQSGSHYKALKGVLSNFQNLSHLNQVDPWLAQLRRPKQNKV